MHRLLILVGFLIAGIGLFSPAAAAELSYGNPFPEVTLALPDDPELKNYLGIENPAAFTLSEIRGELVLVEFLNVHCPHCQMQAPAYNELFKELAAGQEKIRLLGIAVGNLPREVDAFRQAYAVRFPIVADPGFAIWRAIDGTATPYTVYVRQTKSGQPGIVAGTHLGLNTRYRALQAELIKLADLPPEQMVAEAVRVEEARQGISLPVAEGELEYRVRNTLLQSGGVIRDFSRVTLRSGRQVYAARMQFDDRQSVRFAEVVSRPSVCDICHDVHFIYAFDLQGRIHGFASLQLTKYGNVDWNQREITAMRKRLLGKSLLEYQAFNPGLDAISSATITSAMIFDSLNQAASLLEELREKGY